MSERLPCCVPFCRRTIAKDKGHDEWICGKHWALVPKRSRQRFNKARRIMRKRIERDRRFARYWEFPPGSPELIAAVDAWASFDRIWERVKKQAIERAAGI